jgi:hypothetical protein
MHVLRIKGNVLQDLDVLLVVWMERALFGDETLIFLKFICCFLVFNFEFYFLRRCCRKVASLYVIEATLLQMCQSCCNPSGKLVIGGQRVFATLWPIFYWESEVIGNPLTNSSEVVLTILQILHIYQRVADTL